MIHILGNKRKREIFIHLGKKTLSLSQLNFIPDPFPSPFLVSTPLVITTGYTQPLWCGDGWCRKGQSIGVCLSCFLLPTLLFLFVSSAPARVFHGLQSLWGCTCSSMGSSMGHSSFAVEHLLLLWPRSSLWFPCLPSLHIFALS